MLAKGKKGGALRLLIGWERFPFGSADAAEKDRVAFFTGSKGFRRERGAVMIDGDTADPMLGELQIEGKTRSDDVENATGLGHDLGPDAVAGEDSDVVGG